MIRKNILLLLVLVSLLLFSSCGKIRGGIRRIIVSEPYPADTRTEQIISALKDKDIEALKSVFSKKALDEADDFDNDVDYLFELFKGNVDTWERDGWSSDESIEDGKKSRMIRYSFDVKTDEDTYYFYLIDYDKDTINPDNQGVYMLELIKFTDVKDLEAWQDRMRAGLYIH